MATAKKVSSKKSSSNGKAAKTGGRTNNKKGMSTGTKVALASAGLVAAGAAAYFLSDKKRRAKAKGWMVKMKDEAVKKFGSMGNMSKEMYHEAIDKLAAKYKNVRDASPAEIAAMVAEMKKHWSNVSKPKKAAKKSARPAKKTSAKKR
jgi:hypothetical protein